MNSFFGVLSNQYRDEVFSCLSYIKISDDEIVQVNPQKKDYSEAKVPIFAKKEEDREFFTSQNGVVSAYFEYRELVAYTEFILGLECVSLTTDTRLIGEKCITPQYKEFTGTLTRSVWMTENAEMLFILLLVIVMIVVFLGWTWRKGKKLF
jgi:hypothetical protein